MQTAITERVKNFDDVLAIKGITMQDIVKDGDDIQDIANKKAKLIAEVYNEGTVMDGKDKSQWKYFPWFRIDPKSGFGLSYDGYGSWTTATVVGSRLCFKSSELAEDAGKKFTEIYADLLIN